MEILTLLGLVIAWVFLQLIAEVIGFELIPAIIKGTGHVVLGLFGRTPAPSWLAAVVGTLCLALLAYGAFTGVRAVAS